MREKLYSVWRWSPEWPMILSRTSQGNTWGAMADRMRERGVESGRHGTRGSSRVGWENGPWITVFGLSVQGYVCRVTEACALGAVNVMTLSCQDDSNRVYIGIRMRCTVYSIGPDGSVE